MASPTSSSQVQASAGQQSLPADLPSHIKAARAALDNSNDLRSTAAAASEAAKKAVSDAKDATSHLAESIDSISNVIAQASSFDAQWEDFKRKFDDLNKRAIEKIAGMVGGSSASRRPAEMISEQRVAQVLSRASKLVVLTGAGISAESGIPTFRGADGFWTVGSENYRPQELATWEKFNEMPEELWKWYQYRWGICRKAKPNPGHYALVELEKIVQSDFTLVTQNIDGLHLDAGSDRQLLFEIHGRIDEMRCDDRIEGACLHGLDLNDSKNFAKVKACLTETPAPAAKEADECLPCCALCGVRQRPKILWFDESYNEAVYGSRSVQDAVQACDVLLVIGTQLTTGLPSSMVNTAFSTGATIIKMDTIVDLSDERSAGMLHLEAKSGEALPRIVSELRKLREEPPLAPLKELPNAADATLELQTLPAVNGQEPRQARAAAAKLDTLQPLQGPPGSSLRRNSSTLKAKPSAASTTVPSSSTRSNSMAARPGNLSASKRTPSSVAGAPPKSNLFQSRSLVTLKAGGSVSLLKACAANSTCSEMGGAAEGFFVYGTLRPDDDSGAAWTKAFCEGMESEVAFLPSASLYVDGAYPAVSLEQTRCSVRGSFLQPTTSATLVSKLLEADRIEGYPDLYDRNVITVQSASGATRRAYVYHRTGRTDRTQCVRIPDGDWLSRKRG